MCKKKHDETYSKIIHPEVTLSKDLSNIEDKTKVKVESLRHSTKVKSNNN